MSQPIVPPSCFPSLAERAAAFCQIDIYPVVTSEFCAGRDPLAVVREVFEGGARIVQLREKSASDRDVFRLAVKCRKLANRFGALFIVDDRLDVALAANADGVHLGQDDIRWDVAKRLAPELLIGASTHNLAEIQEAQALNVDYLNIGPIFATQTKAVAYPPVGLELLAELRKATTVPTTVMGGVKARHIKELRSIGVERIALVTEITQARDVAAKTRELRSLF
ncbi:MAG: thiamine phosphate synthase [Thermoguttaceae bacterium]|nr:thiamine phosphate synthase [Thermoguttaceae bacterium]